MGRDNEHTGLPDPSTVNTERFEEVHPASWHVAERIREVRQHRDLNQRDLAKILQDDYGYALDASTISKIEKRTRAVQIDELLVIAAALNVAPTSLLAPTRSPWVPVSIGRKVIGADSLHMWARVVNRPAFIDDDDDFFDALSKEADMLAESRTASQSAAATWSSGIRLFLMAASNLEAYVGIAAGLPPGQVPQELLTKIEEVLHGVHEVLASVSDELEEHGIVLR